MAAGTLLGRAVVTKAQRVLNDLHHVNWPLDELVDWGNCGQNQIVLLRPDASSEYVEMDLVAGVRQPLPDNTVRLLDVVRNVGGRAITYCKRADLDANNVDWYTMTGSVLAKHWSFDDRVPQQWLIYPPQSSSPGRAEIMRSYDPTPFTLDKVNGATIDSVIGIPNIFEGALIDYIIYRSYSKDATYTVRGGKADMAWNHFMQSLGLQVQVDKMFSPESNTPPHRTSSTPGKTGAFQQ